MSNTFEKYDLWAEEVITGALGILGLPRDAEVDVTVTDDEEIRALNREFRQLDKSTDVLSFPLNDPEDVQAGQFEINPDTGKIMLGDIVISYETMQRQAIEYGHGEEREFTYLLVHSLLHLIGYDHEVEEDKREMRAMEEKVVGELMG